MASFSSARRPLLCWHQMRILVLMLLSIISSFAVADECSSQTTTPLLVQLDNYTISHIDVQDTNSWGMRMSIGENKQSLILIPSTVVNNVLLMSSELCQKEAPLDLDRCQSKRGGTFDYKASGSGFKSVNVTYLAPDPGWDQIMSEDLPTFDVAGNVSLRLLGDYAIPEMVVAVVTHGKNHTNGHLGLGNDSVILHNLKESGLIPTIGFGLNAGSQSVGSPRAGNVILGGYDQASITDAFRNFTINYPFDIPGGRYCPLQVSVTGVSLRIPDNPDIDLSERSNTFRACIEPYDNLFRLSSNMIEQIKTLTGWKSTTGFDEDQFLVAEPGLYYPSDSDFNATLVFQIENDQHESFDVAIPTVEMFHPGRGLNKDGELVLIPNITQVNIYNHSLDNAVVLGKVFLSQVYLAVNYEANQFQLSYVAQRELSPTVVSFLGLGSETCASASSSCSIGCKAAIGVGVPFGTLLIGTLLYFIFKKKWQARLLNLRGLRGVERQVPKLLHGPGSFSRRAPWHGA